jgi:hypothetical protein
LAANLAPSESIVNAQAWSATITAGDYRALHRHLFATDWRERGAFLLAGSTSDRRLLVSTVLPIVDDEFTALDGHYQISSAAVARAANRAQREGLSLIWAHSHPGATTHVAFSPQDYATIARVHPALVDITQAPVGAVVFGDAAVAGIVSLPESMAPLSHLRVLGPSTFDLHSSPQHTEQGLEERYARQILVFGETGQRMLRTLRVAVVGAGGGGSLIVQMFAHLGIGELCVIDFDRVTTSNLSRIVGATRTDAFLRRRKVAIAKRQVRRIDRRTIITVIPADATDAEVARTLAEFDAVFVATDTALSRHAANAIAYQYMVPIFVVGAKVQADPAGAVATIHTIVRIAMPGIPCLHCQGAIPPDRLHTEQLTPTERQAQNYLGGAEDVPDPSVISLNGIPAAAAVTDFLLMITGLLPADTDLSPAVWYPLERRAALRPTQPRPVCGWCDPDSPDSALGRGDTWPLPLPRRGSPEPRRNALRDAHQFLATRLRRRR